MKTLPKLYKKTTTGAIQEWQVRVEELDGVATIINTTDRLMVKFKKAKSKFSKVKILAEQMQQLQLNKPKHKLKAGGKSN